ncbi:MAG: HAD family hydrolase [Planctomycetota bacterium]
MKALLLDRDGVLNAERGFVTDPDGLEVLPGVGAALRRAGALGYLRIVVSNQSGVARGLLDLRTLGRIHARLRERLGDALEAIYVCPHHPTEGGGALRRSCFCRKPAAGLLSRAARDFALDPAACLMVGDSPRDLAAAAVLGVPGVCVLGPKLGSEAAWPAGTARPEAFVRDLGEAVAWLEARDAAGR